jgi:uncharacterized protein YjbJ (UPF0337 family)
MVNQMGGSGGERHHPPISKITPNRMQRHWDIVKPYLKREWPKLTDVDLEQIDGEYDRLIGKVRELYRTGDEIQIEAGIKGRLQRFLNDLEK